MPTTAYPRFVCPHQSDPTAILHQLPSMNRPIRKRALRPFRLKANSRVLKPWREACEYFEGVSPEDILGDYREFLDPLANDRYLVQSGNAEECARLDTHFSYAENPKTLFTYKRMQNRTIAISMPTREVLGAEYAKRRRIPSCQSKSTNRCNERCIHCSFRII